MSEKFLHETSSLRFNRSKVEILDQTLLPHEAHWVDITSPNEAVLAIQSLKVRGAPLIGVTAAVCLGIFCLQNSDQKIRLHWLHQLISSRPTAVNLVHFLTEMKTLIVGNTSAEEVFQMSVRFFKEDQSMCQKISEVGLKEFLQKFKKDKPKISVLTHCNTGGLATAGVGTALGVIKNLIKDFDLHVFVDETRPLLQGARLTAWELEREKINFDLICDNMAGFLMLQKKVDAVIVGADRITANGDVANKIGTYSLAVLCQYHNIPFYVAAPSTTFDSAIESGFQIPIEQRNPDEVRGYNNQSLNQKVFWAKDTFNVYNPSFDWVPASLISGWITEHKCYKHEDVKKGDFKNFKKAEIILGGM